MQISAALDKKAQAGILIMEAEKLVETSATIDTIDTISVIPVISRRSGHASRPWSGRVFPMRSIRPVRFAKTRRSTPAGSQWDGQLARHGAGERIGGWMVGDAGYPPKGPRLPYRSNANQSKGPTIRALAALRTASVLGVKRPDVCATR